MSRPSTPSGRTPSAKGSNRRTLPTPPGRGGSRPSSLSTGRESGLSVTPGSGVSRARSPLPMSDGRLSPTVEVDGEGNTSTPHPSRPRVVARGSQSMQGGNGLLRQVLSMQDPIDEVGAVTPQRRVASSKPESPQTPVDQIMKPYSPRLGGKASVSSSKGSTTAKKRRRRALPTAPATATPSTSKRRPRKLPTTREQRVPELQIEGSNHAIISPSVPYSILLQSLEELLKKSVAHRRSVGNDEINDILTTGNIDMAQQLIICGAEIANMKGYEQDEARKDRKRSALVLCFTFFNKRGELKDAQLRLTPASGNEAKLSYSTFLFDSRELNVPEALSAYLKSVEFHKFLESEVLVKINRNLEEEKGFYLSSYEEGLQGLATICMPKGQERKSDGSGFTDPVATIASDRKKTARSAESSDLALNAIIQTGEKSPALSGSGMLSIAGLGDDLELQKSKSQDSRFESVSSIKRSLGLLKMLFGTVTRRIRFDLFAADMVSSDSLKSLLDNPDIMGGLFEDDRNLSFYAYTALEEYVKAVEDEDLVRMINSPDDDELGFFTESDHANNFSHAIIDSLKFQYTKMLHFAGFTSLAKLQESQLNPDSLKERYNFLDTGHLDYTLDFVSLHLVHRLKQVFSDSLKVYADGDINGAAVENYKFLFLEKFLETYGKCSIGIASDEDTDFLKSSFEIFDESEASLGRGYSFGDARIKFSLFSDLDPKHFCHNKSFLVEYKKEIGDLKSQGGECDEGEIWQKKFVNFFKRASDEYIEDRYPDIDITMAASSLCLMKNAFPEELLEKFLHSSWRVAALTDVCCGNIEDGVKRYHQFVKGPLTKDYEDFVRKSNEKQAVVIDVFNGLHSPGVRKATKRVFEGRKKEFDGDQNVILDHLVSLLDRKLEFRDGDQAAIQKVVTKGPAMDLAIKESVASTVFALLGDSCYLKGGPNQLVGSFFEDILYILSSDGRNPERLRGAIKAIGDMRTFIEGDMLATVDHQLRLPYTAPTYERGTSPFAIGSGLEEARLPSSGGGEPTMPVAGALAGDAKTRTLGKHAHTPRSLPSLPTVPRSTTPRLITLGKIKDEIIGSFEVSPKKIVEYISQKKSRDVFLGLLQEVDLREGYSLDATLSGNDVLRGKILDAVARFNQDDYDRISSIGIDNEGFSNMLALIKSKLDTEQAADVSFSLVDGDLSVLLPDGEDSNIIAPPRELRHDRSGEQPSGAPAQRSAEKVSKTPQRIINFADL